MGLKIFVSLLPFWLSQTSAQGFFPLHIGDRWEYWDCLQTFPVYALQAVADTILPNGYTYTIVRQAPGGGRGFMRQMGSRVYERAEFGETDILMYDFSRTVGDTVAIHNSSVVTVVYDRLANVFGRTLRQLGFWEQGVGTSFYVLREVTDSLGLTYETFEVSPNDNCLRGAIINGVQYGIIISVHSSSLLVPDKFRLLQNFPNPFNPATHITYELPRASMVRLRVFDILGRQVVTLVNERQEAGQRSVILKGDDLPSGVYLYRLETDGMSQTRRMLLIR